MGKILPVLYVLGIFAASIHTLLGETENAKQPSFFSKHSRTIAWIGNIFILLWIGYWFHLQMRIPVQSLSKFLGEKQHADNSHICMVVSTFLVGMICFSGVAGACAGFMSVFQGKITKRKRIILLIIYLSPAALTVIDVVIHLYTRPFSNNLWLMIKGGLLASLIPWMVNGTTIIFGKHILTLGVTGLHKIIPLNKKPLL